jgi:hypothetical protein
VPLWLRSVSSAFISGKIFLGSSMVKNGFLPPAFYPQHQPKAHHADDNQEDQQKSLFRRIAWHRRRKKRRMKIGVLLPIGHAQGTVRCVCLFHHGTFTPWWNSFRAIRYPEPSTAVAACRFHDFMCEGRDRLRCRKRKQEWSTARPAEQIPRPRQRLRQGKSAL